MELRMKIQLIIGQNAQTYPGEYMPNVVDAWDEYACDGNWEGYQDALKRQQKNFGAENVREIMIEIPDRELTGLWDIPTGHVNIIKRNPVDLGPGPHVGTDDGVKWSYVGTDDGGDIV
jgi:hypothetical protein